MRKQVKNPLLTVLVGPLVGLWPQASELAMVDEPVSRRWRSRSVEGPFGLGTVIKRKSNVGHCDASRLEMKSLRWACESLRERPMGMLPSWPSPISSYRRQRLMPRTIAA